MEITRDIIKRLSPPTSEAKQNKTAKIVFHFACGHPLTGRQAVDLYENCVLHSTVSDIRALGIDVQSERIDPKSPSKIFWTPNTQKNLKASYAYLLRSGYVDDQLALFSVETSPR